MPFFDFDKRFTGIIKGYKLFSHKVKNTRISGYFPVFRPYNFTEKF
jgi:hypothetical protein